MSRFYAEFAPYWPLISPVGEYAGEAAWLASVLGGAETVLELGSGGGHLSSHLAGRFALTLTDLSEEMLALSRSLNPSCAHVAGDMRTLRLGRTFDAVLAHDAIEYMCGEDQLREAMRTAFVHCRPGGRCVLVPDHTRETFSPGTDCGGSDAPDGRGVRLFEWTWDPDPSDDWVQTEYTFVFRSPQGEIRVAHESHRTGLFSEARWLSLLEEVGFEAERLVEVTEEDRAPRTIFVGRRPPTA